MRSKKDVSTLIAALCDGDMNLGARSLWTVEQLMLFGEWADS